MYKLKYVGCLLVAVVFIQTSKAQEKTEGQKKAEAWENFQKMVEQRYHNDWAWLDRYKEDNKKVDLKNNEGRVVFMGNSITDNWDDIHPYFFKDNPFIDRGIGGQTTPQILVRFRQDVVNLHPKAVVILAGTNDIAGNTGPSTLEMIEDNLASMSEIAQANHIKVILSSVLPVYDYPWKRGLEPAKKIVELNKWIKEYASDNGHVYLDYYSSLVDDKGGMISEYAVDGVHPNKSGYKVMEPLVQEAVAKSIDTKFKKSK